MIFENLSRWNVDDIRAIYDYVHGKIVAPVDDSETVTVISHFRGTGWKIEVSTDVRHGLAEIKIPRPGRIALDSAVVQLASVTRGGLGLLPKMHVYHLCHGMMALAQGRSYVPWANKEVQDIRQSWMDEFSVRVLKKREKSAPNFAHRLVAREIANLERMRANWRAEEAAQLAAIDKLKAKLGIE